MSYIKSVYDQLTDALAEPIRDLQDLKMNLIGTKSALLRIAGIEVNNFGDKDYSVTSEIIDNCYINYPLSEVEIFQNLTEGIIDDTSIDVWEILPIELIISFEGDYSQNITKIEKGDLFVDILKDDEANPFPIIMKVIRNKGHFYGKNLVRIKYDLSLQRGTLETAIQNIVDSYSQTPTLDQITPADGTSGVVVNSDIVMDFNIRMNSGCVDDAVTISGVAASGLTPYDYTWNSVFTELTVNPTQNLTSGTVYNVNVSTDMVSAYQRSLVSEFESNFITI